MDSKTDIQADDIFDRSEIDTVIYHHPCTDGFGAAFTVWNYFQNKESRSEDINIEFIPAGYGSTKPELVGKNVLIVDYSYPADIMSEIIQEANSVLIIDHHQTAQKALSSIDPQYCIFDMNHSGAILSWRFMSGLYSFSKKEGWIFNKDSDLEPPLLLRYIEDRDLWIAD